LENFQCGWYNLINIDEINLKDGEILFPNNDNFQEFNNENMNNDNNQFDNNENRFREGFNFLPIINPNIQISNI
jgi:hypothetical protein